VASKVYSPLNGTLSHELTPEATAAYHDIETKVRNGQTLTSTEKKFLNYLTHSQRQNSHYKNEKGENVFVSKQAQDLLNANALIEEELMTSLIPALAGLTDINYDKILSLSQALGTIAMSGMDIQKINWQDIVTNLSALSGINIAPKALQDLG